MNAQGALEPRKRSQAHNNGCHLLSTHYVPDTMVGALYIFSFILKEHDAYFHFIDEETEVQEIN